MGRVPLISKNPAQPTIRHRITPAIDAAVVAWVRSHTTPGGWFYTDGHAMEVALARLRHEYTFIQVTCRAKGMRFNPRAFWSLYDDLIQVSVPSTHGGARSKGLTLKDNARMFANVETGLWTWALGLCVDKNESPSAPKPFQHISHLVETAFRHLQALDVEDLPGVRAPFDGEALWRRYAAVKA